jgi:hypothetical protein
MATDLVTIATTAVLTQFLTPAAKSLGEVVLERAKQVGSKAVGYLAAVGREAQPVEEKILYPLLQAASLESDPTLAEKWAALLANAADPAHQTQVHPSYIDVLRQMTPVDAQVLLYIYEQRKLTGESVVVEDLILHFAESLGSRLELVYDNLLRLRLCELTEGRTASKDNFVRAVKPYFACNGFGREFLAAITPPIP